MGFGPWGLTESNVTEQLTLSLSSQLINNVVLVLRVEQNDLFYLL